MRWALFYLVLLLSLPVMAGGPYRHYRLDNTGGECISTGGSTITTASASPPAIQTAATTTQPFLTAPAANTCVVGVHGVYGAAAIDNLVQRSSLETWAGAGDATGWSETTSAGDGTVSLTEENANVVHGAAAVEYALTGTTSVIQMQSACVTCTSSTCNYDIYLSAWFKKVSGTTTLTFDLQEYDTDACGTFLQNQTVFSGDTTTEWTKQGGLAASGSFHANASSYKIRIREACNGGCGFYFDAVQAREAATPTDAYCGADTDATASCSATLKSIHNPLSAAGTWTINATVRSPIDGAEATPARIILHADGTGGGNENRLDVTWASDVLTCDLYDSGGTKKTSTVAAAGNADTDYPITVYHTSSGRLGCCWGSTCDATEATGALTDDRHADLDIACDGTNAGWVHVSDLEFFRRLVLP